MSTKDLNKLIQAGVKTGEINPNEISDGYHTFGELYDHRIALFIALCNHMEEYSLLKCWKSKKHSDGTMFDGWFIAGINLEPGKQISYHLPLKEWGALNVTELDKAPEWDGHTPNDVITRLKLKLI